MAVLTPVVRAQTLGLSHSRQHGFGAQLHIASSVATGTSQVAVFRAGRTELEQLLQHCRSRLVHAGTNCHLHRFQIQTAGFFYRAEQEPEQMLYFAGDFLLNDFRRFFFCAVSSCSGSRGRAWQIFSLTSNNCSASSRKR
jgi:hypothetical protein